MGTIHAGVPMAALNCNDYICVGIIRLLNRFTVEMPFFVLSVSGFILLIYSTIAELGCLCLCTMAFPEC